jgi:hypothetical protein
MHDMRLFAHPVHGRTIRYLSKVFCIPDKIQGHRTHDLNKHVEIVPTRQNPISMLRALDVILGRCCKGTGFRHCSNELSGVFAS